MFYGDFTIVSTSHFGMVRNNKITFIFSVILNCKQQISRRKYDNMQICKDLNSSKIQMLFLLLFEWEYSIQETSVASGRLSGSASLQE